MWVLAFIITMMNIPAMRHYLTFWCREAWTGITNGQMSGTINKGSEPTSVVLRKWSEVNDGNHFIINASL
jgi:hypothetical protein